MCRPDNSALSWLMGLYSLVPLFHLGWCTVVVLTRSGKSVSHGCLLLMVITSALFNEAILKQIVKQSRPEGSCATSYGMPSGHSLVTGEFLVWHWLSAILSPRWVVRKLLDIFVAGVLLLPILYSRVFLRFHTPSQVVIGFSLGAMVSVAIFLWFHLYGGCSVIELLLSNVYRRFPRRFCSNIMYRGLPHALEPSACREVPQVDALDLV
eukprot:c7915_g1_i1.p1 GENE.c7915_g1_i1~~c7915_g1_i1.p1  ORF type:complete len:222 (-),score=31.05 c7915_g1_i1:36-662(-)